YTSFQPLNAVKQHQVGLAGPVHFCAATWGQIMPIQWYTFSPFFIGQFHLAEPACSNVYLVDAAVE
ncbi:MAG: hypothetical protein ACKOEW_09885, partial [Methylocystis sp.]